MSGEEIITMGGYVEYECEDCGHQEERDVRTVYTDMGEDYEPLEEIEVVGGELEACPACGSEELTSYGGGGGGNRDEGREDFHSDG